MGGKVRHAGALLSLLKDPARNTFEALASSLTLDADIVPVLENLWRQADDGMVASRLDWLIRRARLNGLAETLAGWRRQESPDTVEGAWLVATSLFPDLPFAEVDEAITLIVKDVWLELRDDMSPFERVDAMNRILFVKHGLRADVRAAPPVDSMLINGVLRLKKGTHIGLAIIYMGVAERLNIPLLGVPLPHAFALAYLYNGNIAFYIDSFNGGRIFNATDARRFIAEREIPFHATFIAPCSGRVAVRTLIAELAALFRERGMNRKAGDMDELFQKMMNND